MSIFSYILNHALKILNTFNLSFEVWIFVEDVHLFFPVKLISPVRNHFL